VYIPKFNLETRPDVIQNLIGTHPLATLVTMGTSGLIATHLPLVLHRSEGPNGTLRGHISRANPQWRELNSSVEALAIFTGPEHYITPNWYPEKAEDGKVVPTWNYAVVHAYGPITLIEDPAWLLTHLNSLVAHHESTFPQPWKISDAPEDYIASQLRGIIGIELPIHRLEGKWKVSQNKSEPTLRSIERGLEELDTPESLAMRDLVNGKRD
jgi:transcriptional regulator